MINAVAASMLAVIEETRNGSDPRTRPRPSVATATRMSSRLTTIIDSLAVERTDMADQTAGCGSVRAA
jgi:hypothetical protein